MDEAVPAIFIFFFYDVQGLQVLLNFSVDELILKSVAAFK